MVLSFSCESGSSKKESVLIEVQELGYISSAEVENMLNSGIRTIPIKKNQLDYFGIIVYKVTYWTTDNRGNQVRASGLFAIPDYKSLHTIYSYPLVSDNHGTIFLNNKAPTEEMLRYFNQEQTQSNTLSLILNYTGKLGFAVVMPDYIGYGESVEIFHPYMIEEPLANSVIDMIKAAYEYSEENNLPMRREVYLTGYSEGGFVTMAAAKKLQKYPEFFYIKAALPMAGVYNLEDFGLAILSQQSPIPYPPFIGYVVSSYSQVYDDIFLSQLVQPNFVDKLVPLFDKTKDGDTIYGLMLNYAEKDPQNDIFLVEDLFLEETISNFITNPQFSFRKKLRENNVDDWTPQIKMIIIHCGGDNILPKSLAFATFEKFINNGADNIEFIDPEDVFQKGSLNHSQCSSYAYQIMFNKICVQEYGEAKCLNP